MDANFYNVKGGEMREFAEEVKSNLVTLINQGLFDEAKEIINEYETLMSKDPDIFSIKSIILIKEGNFREAEKVLKRGLQIASDNIDMLYNLGYVYENLEQYPRALNCYSIIKRTTTDPEMIAEIDSIVESIKEKMSDPSYIDKPRIAFFVKQGMDSFLGHIIEGLSQDYETKKVVVTDISQIEANMRWADICWFEWCDDLIIYASKLEIAREKRIVCRLHSYEAFTNYIHEVNWSNVNKVIFVAEHIKNIVFEQVESLKKDQTIVISNGIDISKYTYRSRQKGFNIAYVGYINYKKGPMLLLHTFKAIYDVDCRYKLFIAGKFQDYRFKLYFDQLINEMSLGNNVMFDGWQDDIDKWLDDKNYILSTSVLESQHLSLMEAMSKGIKPVIHNFVGAKSIYKKEYIWNTIDEAIKQIKSDEYDSEEYRSFIMEKYSSERQIAEIRNILNELLHTKINK